MIWLAVGLGLFDLALFVLYIALMVVAFRRLKPLVLPYLKMFAPPEP